MMEAGTENRAEGDKNRKAGAGTVLALLYRGHRLSQRIPGIR